MPDAKTKYEQVADRFLYFAELCRQYAEQVPETADHFRKQADRWERDARCVGRDGRSITQSRALIASIKVSGVLIENS
jgi:hypothetical protein